MQLHKLKKRKINWKRGSGELIGFCLVLPMMCLILFSVVSLMQTGILRQTLEYATYMGARAAVVCENETIANASARQAVLSTLTADHSVGGFENEDVDINLDLVSGTSDTASAGIKWEKGALLRLEVQVPYQLFYAGETRTMSSILYVMVEQPAKTY